MTVLTKEETEHRVPENLRNVVFGLLNLGFKVTYEGPSHAPKKTDRKLRGRVKASKNGVRLVASVSWLGPGKVSSVHFYLVESIAGHQPSLSAKGMKTFWKTAKEA